MIIKCCLIILAQCCFHSLGEPGLYALWILCSRKENSRIEVCEFKKNLRGQFLSALYVWCVGCVSGMVLRRER